ncbi:MAG TPA: ATP-binding protein [Candidatus Angelobacter sp.]|nr:ATP-binding protein [Candidatus Angelobacter sp.]
MRRRLILLAFSTTLFALLLLGAILLSFIWAFTSAAEQQRAQSGARIAAAGLNDTVAAGGVITPAILGHYVRDGARLTATLPGGRTLSTGAPPEGDAYTITSTSGTVTVTASIPKSLNGARIRNEALVTLGLSALALGVSMIVALFYARRLTRPLEDFADVAGRLATGDSRRLDRRYGVPELDAVAEVLDQAVSGFNSLLENERRVTTEASHQLRTPLTALSLRLEEILATDDLDVVHAEATAALGQVERLTGVVDEVVGVSRGSRQSARAPIDVDALVASQVTEWSPAFQAARRRIVRIGSTGLVAVGLPGAQAQALATLIENSLVHGVGATTIRLRGSGSWVVIEVSDEGPGVPEHLDKTVFERSVSGANSSGLGLALARTLVAADGGRLEMLGARPAVFAMFLPAHTAVGSSKGGTEGRTTGDGPSPNGGPAPEAPDAPAPPGQTVVASVSSPAASVSAGNTQRR